MHFLNSRFKKLTKASWQLVLFLVVCSSFAIFELNAQSKVSDEDRRNARLQATYIVRLVTFISWDENSTQTTIPFKIVVLGDEKVGFAKSLKFLIDQGNIKSEGRDVEVFSFPNAESEKALKLIKKGVNFIYFTKDSYLNVEDILPVRGGAMFLAEGRDFVAKNQGCIAFESIRNRLKLVVNETCFRRKFAKVNPVLTSLKSVVEVVKPE